MIYVKVDRGDRFRSWKEVWLEEEALQFWFPDLYAASLAKNECMESYIIFGERVG